MLFKPSIVQFFFSVPPLFPVVIGLAAGHDDYGVKNDEGALL